jgi:C1A family cysteine protease
MPKLRARTVAGYGWSPDLPDHRDRFYSAPKHPKLPPQVDLRPQMPRVYTQGKLGSCTANAIGAAVQFLRRKEGKSPDFVPSRLYVYYNARRIENHLAIDSGVQIRDGMKAVAKLGVCPERTPDRPRDQPHDWAYDASKVFVEPPEASFRFGRRNQAVEYRRLKKTLEHLKGCLAEGYPFVFGFTVYQSFESRRVARTGAVPMPKKHEKVISGHAVVCVGYDDRTSRFLIRNSWGEKWGLGGYCTMPYAMVLDDNLADDLWTIRSVE